MGAKFDVAIVGGGAAGVGAARRLSRTGLSTILLEASSRLGGRAYTTEVAGVPLDLGCGWLHSGDRNSWTRIAEAAGVAVDRREPAWGKQYRDLGFPARDRSVARQAFADWMERLSLTPPASDCAADALEPDGKWNGYIRAITGFLSGATPDRLSVADLLAYDCAATDHNWRVRSGYGTLIAASMPVSVPVRLATPVDAIDLDAEAVVLTTPAGSVRARSVIITVSTAVLAGSAIRFPGALDDWRHAAAVLPLGQAEKLYLEIVGERHFAPETHVIGDPRNGRTGSYYIRPFGAPVIECFFAGEGACNLSESGLATGFAMAIDQLVGLFGADVRRNVRPLINSSWRRMNRIGGAYSYALPGHANARAALASPFDDRLFFAGEATHAYDFSTAHGAHDSGVRAAEEVIAALPAEP